MPEGQQRFKTVTPAQPTRFYGQHIPGVVHSPIGEPDILIYGTIIGMRYVVCKNDRYIQAWEYEVEFDRAGDCPTYSVGWYTDDELSNQYKLFEWTLPAPVPVFARTHDEMQRNHTVFPNVVVELNDDAFNVIGRRHLQVSNATLVEAVHDAHRTFFYAMEFVASLRYIKGVTGYPKGTDVQLPK